MKLDYQIDQAEKIKEKANSAKNSISKQIVATAAIKGPLTAPAQPTQLPVTSEGFGRTV